MSYNTTRIEPVTVTDDMPEDVKKAAVYLNVSRDLRLTEAKIKRYRKARKLPQEK